LLLLEGGSTVELTSSPTNPLSEYLVNGWIAFRRDDPGARPKLWVRSPAGVETQLADLRDGEFLVSLTPGGEVLFGRLMRAAVGVPPAVVAGDRAIPLYVAGQLYVGVGSKLYRVD
jgi:hypothetical protein